MLPSKPDAHLQKLNEIDPSVLRIRKITERDFTAVVDAVFIDSPELQRLKPIGINIIKLYQGDLTKINNTMGPPLRDELNGI